ncbi:hypothetical protein BKA69DRAFT_1097819 [Paraphysoderma sedebokerense]|nr:hypothetical protein BKA69DRAFT_1097819 [Paraphysoderma sedebokerense]
MSQPKVLITCIGSRGDVQPFLYLSKTLKNQHNCQVIVGAHPEFQKFVESYHVQYFEIGCSMVRELQTEDGQKVKKASALSAMSAGKAFFKRLMRTWIQDIGGAIRKYEPDVVVFSTFGLYCGAHFFCLDTSGQKPTVKIPFVVVHTVPASPTSEFLPPTAGMGVSLPFGFMNKMLWNMGMSLQQKMFGVDVWNATFTDAGINLQESSKFFSIQTTEFLKSLEIPVLYIYSPHLLPSPKDWSPHEKVTGAVIDVAEETSDTNDVPPELQHYISTARQSKKIIVYIGFGSMLGTMFDSDTEITHVLDTFVQSIQEISKSTPIACIIHTVTSPSSHALPKTQIDPNVTYVLNSPVRHSALFKSIDMVVHHGGIGTLTTTLVAGLPAVVFPCSVASDQPFWGAVLDKIGCGVKGLLLTKNITPKTVTKVIVGALKKLDEMKLNCGQVAVKLREEKGGENLAKECLAVLKKK